MVYGRTIDGKELELEASGALLSASLVMRDRQTDSWWSIMSHRAIGGPMEGARLPVLPVGEKTTWGAWRTAHPDTLVLSVDGREHVESDPYAGYFASDDTFRGLPVGDDRLPPKTPVYAFHLGGRAWAVPHTAFEGGRVLPLPGAEGRSVVLHRAAGAPIFASSEAWAVEGARAAAERAGTAELLARLRSAGEEDGGAERLGGVDTYWYTWVVANPDTELLR